MDKMEIMICGENGKGGSREAALIFNREDLLGDIANYCWIEGHRITEEDGESRHMIQDATEDYNRDRITRVLDMTHADIVERLYPFTQREIDNPAITNRLHEGPLYGVVLNVPEEFSQTTLNLLGKLIHEMMVCSAMADWMSLTNPEREETWRGKAAEAFLRINEIRNARRGRIRIRQHWIG